MDWTLATPEANLSNAFQRVFFLIIQQFLYREFMLTIGVS